MKKIYANNNRNDSKKIFNKNLLLWLKSLGIMIDFMKKIQIIIDMKKIYANNNRNDNKNSFKKICRYD